MKNTKLQRCSQGHTPAAEQNRSDVPRTTVEIQKALLPFTFYNLHHCQYRHHRHHHHHRYHHLLLLKYKKPQWTFTIIIIVSIVINIIFFIVVIDCCVCVDILHKDSARLETRICQPH